MQGGKSGGYGVPASYGNQKRGTSGPAARRFQVRVDLLAQRAGVDQLPGSCMEFYMSDDGVASVNAQNSVLIAARDVPLVYMGSMNHHPIKLCDKNAENNARPLYSWIMNNNWETNFKMDLSGFCQYDYSLWLSDITMPDAAMDELHEQLFDPYVLIIG